MGDRLDVALERAIDLLEDDKVREILSSVRSLNDELGYLDWWDFEERRKDGTLDEMIRAYFD